MGTGQVKKQITLQKEFAFSFIWVLVLSMAASLMAISLYYFFEHHHQENNSADLTKIMEYASTKGSAILEPKNLDVLNSLVAKTGMMYQIRKIDKLQVYPSELKLERTRDDGIFQTRITRWQNNFSHRSNILIPIFNHTTKKTTHMLELSTAPKSVLIDILIPFIFFILFSLIFSKHLSKKIKKPLQELKAAVTKIKARDLNFSVKIDQNNEIGDFAGALEDMRAGLQSSLIREWQLEQDRREMVAAITHDLRTPLAIIQGHVEGLQDGLKRNPGKLDNYLSVIMQNSERAKRMVEEMNRLVEVDSPEFKINLVQLDINEFIQSKITEFQLLTDKKEIRIDSRISDERPEKSLVSVDPERLAQVIDNIVSNNIRFTPPGGTVYLETNIKEDSIHIRISDNGPGFSNQDLTHLFKKFYKGDPSRSKDKRHSGLGLYIAKSIVEKHNGAIKAFNLQSGGACVEFHFQI